MNDQPVLRVIRGNATDEEIAAILAVLGASIRRTAPAATSETTSVWAGQGAAWGRRIGRGMVDDAGVSTWRTSYWPH